MAESRIPVKISWGSKKFDTDCDPSEGLEVFQAMVFSLTGVPPAKQTILYKKKALTDISVLKKKARLKLIGTAESAPSGPTKEIIFQEDLSKEDQAKLGDATPPGLGNLGNTCYLNASLQALKAVPEFNESLATFGMTSLDPSVSKALGQLFAQMNRTTESFQPYGFVQLFRQAFPSFAQMDPQRRGFIQQDADEFVTKLLTRIQQDKVGDGKLVDNLFQMEAQIIDKCSESDEVSYSTDTLDKLTCFVSRTVSHLIFGIQNGLTDELEKHSEKSGRTAVWKRETKVSKLSPYLIVNLNRFEWKQTDDGGVPCKQLRKVTFPHKLDLSTVCTEELKKRIMGYRQAKIDWEDEQREKRQAEGLGLENQPVAKKKKEEDAAQKIEEKPGAAAAAAEPMEEEEEVASAVDVTKEDDAMDVEPPAEKLPNETGEYTLIGVVTHKGRSANSGHYIGYGKDLKTNRWMKYDDDYVTEVKETGIESLYGGGDFQMGYICVYKKIEADKIGE